MNYIINHLNGQTEITPNTIEIVGLNVGNPNISNINFQTKMFSVEVLLITDKCTFGLVLDNVQAESLNFATEGGKIYSQVLTALDNQYGVKD